MQPIEIVAFLYQIADVFAFLVLAAAGLAIIFGMMGIINMAHGEFIAMGGYVTTYAYQPERRCRSPSLIGAVACGLFGMFLERTIVRRFYHRPIDSLVATWGISLIMTQGALLLLGSGAPGVGTPFGSVSFGGCIVLRLSARAGGGRRRGAGRPLPAVHEDALRPPCPSDHAERRAWRARSAFPSTGSIPSPSAWAPRSPASPAASMRRP